MSLIPFSVDKCKDFTQKNPILASTIGVVSVLAGSFWFYRSRWDKQLRIQAKAAGYVMPQGTMSWPFLGDTVSAIKGWDDLEFWREKVRRYGPVFKMNMLGSNWIVRTEPEAFLWLNSVKPSLYILCVNLPAFLSFLFFLFLFSSFWALSLFSSPLIFDTGRAHKHTQETMEELERSCPQLYTANILLLLWQEWHISDFVHMFTRHLNPQMSGKWCILLKMCFLNISTCVSCAIFPEFDTTINSLLLEAKR